MAVKTAEERIDSLERAVRWYRLLFLGALLFLFATQRYRVAGWMDSVEDWASSATARGRD